MSPTCCSTPLVDDDDRAQGGRLASSCSSRSRTPGLGNGGLGRLAACFLDSMATMQLPAMGYGLRYEYGIFRQTIEDGWQQEQPDNWLRHPDPWEVARPNEKVEVKLNCSFEVHERHAARQFRASRPRLFGIPFDRPVVGYGGKTINTLRLWAAAAPDYFDFQEFSSGDFVGAVAETLAAESLTRVSVSRRFDQHGAGPALRAGVFPGRLLAGRPGPALPAHQRRLERAARQGRHPAQRHASDAGRPRADAHSARRGAPGLGRGVGPSRSGRWPTPITRCCPKRWRNGRSPGSRSMLPRQLEIIYEINRRLLDDVRKRFPGDEGRVERVSLIEEGAERKVRMANLAIVGSHSTNGVAAIHSELLRTMTVKDLAEMFPERFNNKTNGVTPRRWLLLANPALARRSRGAIGDGWITDLDQLEETQAAGRRQGLSGRFPQGQARGQGEFRRLAQEDLGRGRRSRHDLRLPDQAHPRIQAATAQRAAHRRALQPAAGKSEARQCRRAPSSSPARRRRPTSSPSSSSSSSTTSPARSTATRRCAASSRWCSCPSTASPWPSG